MRWNNGDQLSGEVLKVDGSFVTWKSDSFAEPLQINTNVLQNISYEFYEGANKNNDPYMLLTLSGGRFFGNLESVDDEKVTISSKRFGQIEFSRTHVAEIFHLSQANLLIDSIDGLAKWDRAKRNKVGWKVDEMGSLKTETEGAILAQSIDIKKTVRVEIELQWQKELGFALGFEVIRSADQMTEINRIETWDDSLVLSDTDGDFEPIYLSIKEATGKEKRLNLTVLLEAEKEQIRVFDLTGKLLCTKKVEGKKLNGFSILNKQPHELKVNRFRATECSPDYVPSSSGVQSSSGEPIIGEAKSFDGKNWSVVNEDKETQVAADKVSSITINGTGNKTTTSDSGSVAEDSGDEKPITASMRFYDGISFVGQLNKLDAKTAEVKLASSPKPATFNLDKIALIAFSGKPAKSLKAPHTITVDGKQMQGQLLGKGSKLLWKAIGAREGVPVADSDLKIQMSKKDPAAIELSDIKSSENRQWPDKLYLLNQDVVSCKVLRITKESLVIETAIKKSNIPNSEIRAIDFGVGFEVKSVPADEETWYISNQGKKSITSDKVGFTMTRSNGYFAHPNLFAGGDLQFDLSLPQKPKIIDLRLFVEDVKKTKNSLRWTMHSSNGVISSYVVGNGIIRDSNQNRVNVNNKKVRIRVQHIGNSVILHVNEQIVRKIQINPNVYQGKGIAFSSKDGASNPENQAARFSNFVASFAGKGRTQLDKEKIQRALTIPRLQKKKPPKHILCSKSGDLLRGNLISFNDGRLLFQSKLDEFRFAQNKISSIVWLHPKSENEKEQKKVDATKNENGNKNEMVQSGLVQVVCKNQQRVSLRIIDWNSNSVQGTNQLLGEYKIPTAEIVELRKGSTNETTNVRFANWNIKYAKEVQLESSSGAGNPATQSELVGTIAKDFTATDSNGKTVSLAELRGKIIVLDFWATWCGPCVKSLPGLAKTVAKFDTEKVIFLPVNQGESRSQVDEFLKRKSLDFPSLLDPSGDIGKGRFNVSSIPQTVIIDQTGKIALLQIGASPQLKTQIEEKIKELLRQRQSE